MKHKIYIVYFILGILLLPQTIYAQVDLNKKPEDGLGNFEDEFQEHFYEALKEKSIENYDRSANAFLKCIALNENVPVLYFELGKNYNKLKKFGEAEDAFKKAVRLEPENEWFLDELYGLYASQNEYEKAIQTVKQLVQYHPDYREDLASLYLKVKKYDEALDILDALDKAFGISLYRDKLRNRIYKASGRKKEQLENLEERVEKNPNKQSNYLELIFHYSENNQKEKAFETAKELLKINPTSEIVHLALYKFYLDDDDTDKAIKSMKIVINSSKIKPETKLKVLSDFVSFVKNNPEYEADLVEATHMVDNNEKTLTELGGYYLSKNNKLKALECFQDALNKDPNNFNILKKVLLLQTDLEQYKAVSKKSAEAIEKYPSQPIFYLINAVALNKLNNPNKAIESLEIGVDYIIDDITMKADYYTQFSKAYTLLNNSVKAKEFNDKVKQIQTPNK